MIYEDEDCYSQDDAVKFYTYQLTNLRYSRSGNIYIDLVNGWNDLILSGELDWVLDLAQKRQLNPHNPYKNHGIDNLLTLLKANCCS